jgi:hypothetical protein
MEHKSRLFYVFIDIPDAHKGVVGKLTASVIIVYFLNYVMYETLTTNFMDRHLNWGERLFEIHSGIYFKGIYLA